MAHNSNSTYRTSLHSMLQSSVCPLCSPNPNSLDALTAKGPLHHLMSLQQALLATPVQHSSSPGLKVLFI
jgi:hypothetical protein